MIVDAYVRVSRVGKRKGERFISPEVQRERIHRWADRNEAIVARVFEDIDESGGRPDRPGLEEAIARVKSGETRGVVVAYLSRLDRSLLHGLKTIEQISNAGGTLISVEENIDFSTDTGRLMLRMWLSWAEWELDHVRSSWMIAKERAIARGVSPGRTPFGYVRGGDGRFRIDPVRGPVVTELFRRRAAGAEYRDLVRYLARRGMRTHTGCKSWHPNSVRDLLARRVYRGEVHSGPLFNVDAHPALVDETTWQCAQRMAQTQPPMRDPEPTLLAGLLRCSGCQRVLAPTVRDSATSSEDHIYRCGRRSRGCPHPVTIVNSRADPYIEALFWQELPRAARRRPGGRLNRLARQRDRREQQLDAYRDNAALPVTLGPERFARGLAVRTTRAERAAIDHARAQLTEQAVPPHEDDLRERWPSMTVEQRRTAIKTVIDCVFVLPGRRGPNQPVEERVFVILRGGAPQGLPGNVRYWPGPTEPFDPERGTRRARLRRVEADLTESELRTALSVFLAGRERWASFTEFQAAGQTSLYTQVERHGGQRHWAGLLDVAYVPGRIARMNEGKRESWPYARIKHELRQLVGEGRAWPTGRAFKAAGLENLYQAICNSGTRERLAAELGLELPARNRPLVWTDDAIETALDRFLEGRTEWPTFKAFEQAGLCGLIGRLKKTGRRDAVARRYGFSPPRRGRPGTRDRPRSARRQRLTTDLA